ncbi:MAG: cell division protein FtsQ/DivIB [Lachnospiraceae bacterium]|nr:cell division protein FtsQ/DivIB [Lachnospiraceae bacterium]MDY4971685.1 cell division protein FtsQ/DivIB [Lachnospiraceae bacterium]
MLDSLKEHRARWIALLLILIFAAAAAFIIKSSTIETVKVTGNHFYTEDEIRNFLFDSKVENNTIKCYLNNRFGKNREIPFVERYQIEIISRHEVEVIVYEKNIIGYVDYMGSYMYFDRDGTVVESSSELLDGICQVQGLSFSRIVLYEPIETQVKDLFDQVLLMTQLFEKYELDIERIYFDDASGVQIFTGDIRVELGAAEDLDLKIAELHDILPQLKGMKGTLYLDDVRSGASSDGTHYFKKE